MHLIAASGGSGGGAGIFGGLLGIICFWILFSKAGKPGWAAIIPLYSLYTAFDVAWGRPWYFLLMLIPLVNLVVYIIFLVKLSYAFGKGGGFAVGLILLPILFLPILALGSSEYVGPQA